jgi:hypothetical protein
MRDLYNHIEVRRAISPVSEGGDTAVVSQIIDRQGFDTLTFLIATGSLADANATFAVLVEDGNNSALSDNGAVADAQLLGTEALAGFQFDDDNEVRKIGYVGDKRYVRLTITPSGNSGAALVSAVAVLSQAATQPTA